MLMPLLRPEDACSWRAASWRTKWSSLRAAERFQVSATTAARRAARYRELGPAGMADRFCRPHHSPGRTCARTERHIISLRVKRRWGAGENRRPAGHPSLDHAPSAFPLALGRLTCQDRATGRVIRCHEHAAAGYQAQVPPPVPAQSSSKASRQPAACLTPQVSTARRAVRQERLP